MNQPDLTTAPPSSANEIDAVAQQIAVTAREMSTQIDDDRRLPEELVALLGESGLLRAGAPAEVGGLELPPGVALRCAEAVARGNASAGWCVSIAITSSLLVAYLPASSRDALFGDGRGVAAGVWAPRGTGRTVDGGVVVSGRWPFCSGILHADMMFAGCLVDDQRVPSVVATSLDKSRHTMGIGVQSMVRRVPMMLGPLIGGWLLTRYGWARGVQLALLGCIGLSLATAVFQWFLLERPTSNSTATNHTDASFSAVIKSFTPALRELLVSDILIRFCERIPYVFVILWAMNHGGLDAQQYSYLVAIEMVTAMLSYIPVAHLADKHGRRPFVLVTFIFFTLFPVTLLWAKSFFWLAVAFAVRGLKEFGEPARKACPRCRCVVAAPTSRRRSRARAGRAAP